MLSTHFCFLRHKNATDCFHDIYIYNIYAYPYNIHICNIWIYNIYIHGYIYVHMQCPRYMYVYTRSQEKNASTGTCLSLSFIFLFFLNPQQRICFYWSLERGRVRVREEHQCEKEIWIRCFSYTPRPGIKPANQVCALTGNQKPQLFV